MFNFNIRKSIVAPAIFGEKYFRLLPFLRDILIAAFLPIIFVFLWGFFFGPFSEKTFSKILGTLLLILIFIIITILQEFFYHGRCKNPKPKKPLSEISLAPENCNLADFLSLEAAKTIWRASKWARRKGCSLNSTLFLYFLLQNNESSFIFLRAGLDREGIKRNLRLYLQDLPPKLTLESKSLLYTKDFQKVLLDALQAASQKNKKLIGVGDLIYILAKSDPFFKKVLIQFELKTEDIGNLVEFQENLKEKIAKMRRFWEAENLARFGSIGKDFAAGYTITLDQYSHDWTLTALSEVSEGIVGHQQEIEEIERILSRSTLNNVLLVGRPGSSRRQIILNFARRSYLGQSLPLLNYKRVIALNLPSLVAQIETIEKAEGVLDRIFREVSDAGNVVLVIEDFHDYVEPKPRPGVLNISGLLSSYLDKVEFQLITITSYVGLHEYIEQHPSLLNYFGKVEVREISEEETLRVLEDWVPKFEKRYKKIISYPCLKEIVKLSARYLPDTAFPQKAIDLLDEVMVYASEQLEHPFVLPADVDKVVTEKTEIPVGKIEEKEKETLLNLEKLIHDRIINQEEAVGDISEALRRARTEITIRKGPMGGFLFLGPTGVGKTETSKALAEIYFGSETRMVRLDMSEFQAVADVPRLIGSVGQEGLLTTQVRENPFSLVLLDEIEKAHPNILNLFLQVLDEGFLTDGMGRKVNFRNTIIIGTSNAGSDFIWKAHGDITKNDLMLYLIDRKIFRPEFLNRFDSVVLFQPLSRSNLLDIAELLLGKLKKNLEDKEITLLISPPVKEKIVDLSYSPRFGAREMRRVIQEKIENILAVALLKGDIKKGDKVKLELKEFGEFKLTVSL